MFHSIKLDFDNTLKLLKQYQYHSLPIGRGVIFKNLILNNILAILYKCHYLYTFVVEPQLMVGTMRHRYKK